jgi:hypothetical protein
MVASGWRARPAVSRCLDSPSVRLAAPFAGLAVLFAVDLAGGRGIRISGLVIAVPALSAVFLAPLPVLVVAAVAMGCVVITSVQNASIDTENFPVVIVTTVLVGAGSVQAARLRRRRERQLAQARRVAEVTQRALLRPLPPRLGPVTISSMYLAADEEAAIGGDLYAAARAGRASRVMVGDVQGKGLGAVEVTALLLGAFRRAVRDGTELAALPSYLDADLRDDLADLARDAVSDRPAPPARGRGAAAAEHGRRSTPGIATGPATSAAGPDPVPAAGTRPGSDYAELFVTAVAVDVADDGSTVRVTNCGHPPPLLIHNGTVATLLPGTPELPLGLGDLSGGVHHVDVHPFAVGDILLLYTDGVTEARDPAGVFYPLAERLPRWAADTPDALLEDIRADLLRHAEARLSDDIAMVAVQRVA